jgi:adenylate cyclase
MATEIERKFLVQSEDWRKLSRSTKKLRQGYLCIAVPPAKAEVRLRCTPERAFITIKGSGGLARSEFEYEIPLADAELMLGQFCSTSIIEKSRHRVEFGGAVWEVDEYSGAHQGLVLAEVELQETAQEVQLPDWLGREVTNDPNFKNANLAAHPHSWWESKNRC